MANLLAYVEFLIKQQGVATPSPSDTPLPSDTVGLMTVWEEYYEQSTLLMLQVIDSLALGKEEEAVTAHKTLLQVAADATRLGRVGAMMSQQLATQKGWFLSVYKPDVSQLPAHRTLRLSVTADTQCTDLLCGKCTRCVHGRRDMLRLAISELVGYYVHTSMYDIAAMYVQMLASVEVS